MIRSRTGLLLCHMSRSRDHTPVPQCVFRTRRTRSISSRHVTTDLRRNMSLATPTFQRPDASPSRPHNVEKIEKIPPPISSARNGTGTRDTCSPFPLFRHRPLHPAPTTHIAPTEQLFVVPQNFLALWWAALDQGTANHSAGGRNYSSRCPLYLNLRSRTLPHRDPRRGGPATGVIWGEKVEPHSPRVSYAHDAVSKAALVTSR